MRKRQVLTFVSDGNQSIPLLKSLWNWDDTAVIMNIHWFLLLRFVHNFKYNK